MIILGGHARVFRNQSGNTIAFATLTAGELIGEIGFLEPESEVCTVDQEATSVSRFSMTPIIVSLAKPTAIMTRAS